MAKNQRMIPEAALPGAEGRAEQAAHAAESLAAAGYEAIGIDHFARPEDPLAEAARSGLLHRNFQGYTTDAAATLIGLGATAIGRTPEGYVQAIGETGAWARAVRAGRLPVARGFVLSSEDRLRAYVIERIMCDGAVDTAAAGERFGAPRSWCAGELAALGELEADGIVVRDGDHIALTLRGRPLARIVAAVFDSYLVSGEARHSRAV
jgi:oxygen-independent coproporphyrinogen-3 oxidase